jgi:type IV pilus assembly protein PilE
MTEVHLSHFDKPQMSKKMAGFTLIELMLVLAVISILVSVAIPSYRAYVLKSQRTEGQVLLLEIQTYLERFYFANQYYPKGLSELRAYQSDRVDSDNLYYQVTLEEDESCSSDSCYLLKAKHVNGQEEETLSIASSGEKQGLW